jgi:tetratricopeptide (TPR) repeat protein
VRNRSPAFVLSLVPIALAAMAIVPSGARLDLPKALATQQEIVASDPANAAAQVDLGNLLLLDGKTAEAEAAYRQAIAVDPASVNAHFNLGLLLQQRGENLDASREFKRVIDLDPDHAWANYQLGVVREGWGMESAAVRSYARAFALNPRLAFSDVNPHIVENKLVTQAMIRAYGKESAPLQPSVAYEEPSRIAAILVGKPTSERARVAATPEASAPGAEAPAAPADATAASGQAAGARTLGSSDLSGVGESGQASGSGRSYHPPVTRVVPQTDEEPEVEIYEPPVPTLRIPTPSEPVAPGAPAPSFTPGAPSTGRLEMNLRDAWGREIGLS